MLFHEFSKINLKECENFKGIGLSRDELCNIKRLWVYESMPCARALRASGCEVQGLRMNYYTGCSQIHPGFLFGSWTSTDEKMSCGLLFFPGGVSVFGGKYVNGDVALSIFVSAQTVWRRFRESCRDASRRRLSVLCEPWPAAHCSNMWYKSWITRTPAAMGNGMNRVRTFF